MRDVFALQLRRDAINRWSLAGLATAFLLPPLALFVIIPEIVWTFSQSAISTDVAKWSIVALLVVVVILGEDRDWSALGIRKPTLEEIAVGILLVPIIMLMIGFVMQFLINSGMKPDDSAMSSMTTLPVWMLALSTFTAAVTEEILYRGYAIERLTEITGNPYLAGGLATVLFALVHVPAWGWVNAVAHVIVGGSFAAIYIRYRSLTAPILLHLGYNALAIGAAL